MPDEKEYVSSIVGKISEETYKMLDRPYKELIAYFYPKGIPRKRRPITPAVLTVEKDLGGQTVRGIDIYRHLKNYGFDEEVASNVMQLFSKNRMVNDLLEHRKFDIKELVYTTSYLERLHMTGAKSLEIYTRAAMEDEIYVQPLKIPEEVIPPELCSFFEYIDQLVGVIESDQLETYRMPNQIDKLTTYIEERNYDGALKRVHKPINDILNRYFKTLHLKRKGEEVINEPDLLLSADELGFGTVEKPECPESRTYELQIYPGNVRIPFEPESAIYGLKYTKGAIVNIHGFGDNFPIEDIIDILKKEGKWEE